MSGQAIIWVAFGGALGAVARYATGLLLKTTSGFPWATLSVNIFGSLLMGVMIGWLSRQSTPNEALRLFLAVGILGGFTTFSTFSMDLFQLIEKRDMAAMALYLGGSLFGGVAAFILGFMALRAG
ncbi:MAG: fluoride efflux transporter CrcB [PS1 clade bacterium]|uniref:Fluoride-specific ion channel FluC n=1 Tax=PS1 clade bacterium TaxID=2175152 RepID=A0A937HM83_9PROT|nr:fluoride efflux transporter CrcB [PS1 clade bacterium]